MAQSGVEQEAEDLCAGPQMGSNLRDGPVVVVGRVADVVVVEVFEGGCEALMGGAQGLKNNQARSLTGCSGVHDDSMNAPFGTAGDVRLSGTTTVRMYTTFHKTETGSAPRIDVDVSRPGSAPYFRVR
jgi:hypothetical protein